MKNEPKEHRRHVIDPFERESLSAAARKLAGLVDGVNYTAHVPMVRALRKAGDNDAAAGWLLRLISAVEREAQYPSAGSPGIPRWYFEQLAAIYRKEGMKAAADELMKRHALLQAQVETEGQALLLQVRTFAAMPSEPAGDSPPAMPRRVEPERPRTMTMVSANVGRAVGRAFGLLVGLLKSRKK
jgi:hypothetical protein